MIILNEPSDGWDQLEKMFLRELVLSIYRGVINNETYVKKEVTILQQYRRALSNTQNAFIFMAINESGYSQQEVASILGISQVAVQKRLKNTIEEIRRKEQV